jgi:hypothetical protein
VKARVRCEALRVCRATFYRRLRPSTGHQQPRPTPAPADASAVDRATCPTHHTGTRGEDTGAGNSFPYHAKRSYPYKCFVPFPTDRT